jgi:hypothetical protein
MSHYLTFKIAYPKKWDFLGMGKEKPKLLGKGKATGY